MGIQSNINQMLGVAAGGIAAGKNMYAQSQKLVQKQQEAMKKAEEVKQAKATQKTKRRNFMNYLKNEPTSLGGTVGELPVEVQKKIAAQYTKSQRKALMDRVDKEVRGVNKE